jgi:hypothetical protein
MLHIRAIAQRQINLDRCAGGAAHSIRHLLADLTASNQRVEAARAATLPLLATPSGPAAEQIFRQLLRLESMIQQAIKAAWISRETRWNDLPGAGCGLRNQPRRSRFPPFEFKLVDPEASIFETASTGFLLNAPREVRLEISVARLKTGALVRKENNGEWSVRWSQ